MAYTFITMKKDERVLTINLNRPPTNPLSSEFGQELFNAFDEASQMDDVTVVVITSAQEKAFIAGADIKEMAAMSLAESEAFSKLLQNANNTLEGMKKVVIAAINGHALGGGCELAMACDYRFMAAGKALIGLPEATLGIIPGAGGTQRLPRLVGLSRAMDILLRGKTMGPEEALAIGLIDRVIVAEQFMDEVMQFATQLATGAGKAMGYIKAAVYEGINLPMEQGLAVERKYSLENHQTLDAREGLTAFAEKPDNPETIPGRDTCFASMGNYIFSTKKLIEVLLEGKKRHDDLDFGKHVIPMMLEHGDRVFAYNFNDNVIPGMKAEERGYWKDVGTLDSYYEANMDLINVSPQLNLYNYKWPILTNQGNLPPAKTVFDDDDRRGQNIDSYVCAGCITSGSTVRRSILGPLTKVNSYSLVEDSILFENVTVGRHVKIRRAIIDKNVVIPDGSIIGYDLKADRAKGYTVTESGIVVVPRKDK